MKEIERKFLLSERDFTEIASLGKYPLILIGIMTQGYILVNDAVTLRVRISRNKNFKQSFLTVKGVLTDNTIERIEEEMVIDNALAEKLLASTDVLIKGRYFYGAYTIDVFLGDLEGLIIAEKEYSTLEEAMSDTVPEWVSGEVTNNPMYLNHNLIGKQFINGTIS